MQKMVATGLYNKWIKKGSIELGEQHGKCENMKERPDKRLANWETDAEKPMKHKQICQTVPLQEGRTPNLHIIGLKNDLFNPPSIGGVRSS